MNHDVDSCCFYKNQDKDVDAIFEQLFEPDNGATTSADFSSIKPTWLNNANTSKKTGLKFDILDSIDLKSSTPPDTFNPGKESKWINNGEKEKDWVIVTEKVESGTNATVKYVDPNSTNNVERIGATTNKLGESTRAPAKTKNVIDLGNFNHFLI